MNANLHKRLFQFLMLLAVATNLYYLHYRFTYTINYNAIVFSIVFLLAEVYGVVTLFLYFFDLWAPGPHREAPPPGKRHTVDVYIPTYNEDISILHRTVLAARDMTAPHETYLLDDGNRADVRALAERLGVRYIARPEHVHAKAGNINYALARTQGRLITIFDADHVPQPDFLDRLLGYFDDDRMGFVQTPHVFYNLGSFQTTADFRQRKYWDDQQLFFRVIQPGKDRSDAAFFCGSCGIIRRECLEEIGGLDFRTITEDMHSSLRIHANGWKSVYHDEPLAAGLSAGDLGAYWKQRMRWAVGNLSIMWHDNPLLKRGLTLRQRLSYFSSVWAWTTGPQKLVYYFTPPFMLLTGLYPIAHFDWTLLRLYVINLVISLTVYKIISRGYARIVRGELYSMVNAFMLTAAMFRAIFRLGTTRFVVTKKAGRSEHVLAYVLPQVTLIVATYWCALWALMRFRYNMALDMTLTAVAGGWSGFNAMLAFLAVRIAHVRIDVRKRYRFHHRLPVRYEIEDRDGRALTGLGTTLVINEVGMDLRAFQKLPIGADVSLTIFLPDGAPLRCRGRLPSRYARNLRAAQAAAAGWSGSATGKESWDYGIEFAGLSPEALARLDRYFTRVVIPGTFRFLAGRSSSWARRVQRWFGPRALRRRFPRKGVQLPLALRRGAPEADDIWYVTDDLSASGTAVTLEIPGRLGEETGFTLLTPLGRIEGTARFVREEKVRFAHGDWYRYGLEFVTVDEADRARIRGLGRYALEEEVRA